MIRECKPYNPIKKKFALFPTHAYRNGKQYFIWWETYYQWVEYAWGGFGFHNFLDLEEALKSYNGEFDDED